MGGKRQNNQLELAFTGEDSGEAPKVPGKGTEPFVALFSPESPAGNEGLMEDARPENLKKALRQVRRNKGCPGIDGMSVEQLSGYLVLHWSDIREQLLSGTYKPMPVKRVEIAKPGGGVRKLGIPTVVDRFIQQAVLQVLQRRWDPTFSAASFGFRPGRSAHQAVARAQEYIRQGYGIVVDIDLEKFFDRVNHDMLMGRVAKRESDKRVLKLIRSYLNAGVLENGLISPTDEGTPQGGPLSPLLSNIVLDDLDSELEKRGLNFVRYADDCNIYVKSERAGERVMASISRFITVKLKLKVNREKSAVARPQRRKILGFSFTWGKEAKRRIAPQALLRFRKRVRELTRRSKGMNIKQTIAKLAEYLNGWRGYYGFCETPSVLEELSGWLRRRLRCVLWRQWKRGKKRFAELVKRGVGKDLAAITAGNAYGPWRNSGLKALQIALPNAWFISLGLPKLALR
jgi:RNA-directed DNA polymerase